MKSDKYVVVALGLILWLGLAPRLSRAAGPAYWDWPADRPFEDLKLQGTALDEQGHLTAGLSARLLAGGGAEVFWQAVPDGEGGLYTGSGHSGEIHHVGADGRSRLVARLETAEVFSLLVLPDGDLLAGCGPDGGLYRINGEGQSRLLGTVAGGYIWSMAAEGTAGVWLAAGSPGALYHYDLTREELVLQAHLPAENVMAVHATKDQGVLVATQGPGLIYRLESGHAPELLYEMSQDEGRAFIEGPGGQVFLLALAASDQAATVGGARAPKTSNDVSATLLAALGGAEPAQAVPAALYRIGDDDLVTAWWAGPRDLITAVWSDRWGWLGAGDLAPSDDQAVVWQLFPPRGMAPLARWSGGDVLNLMVPPSAADDVIVSQAHPGAVYHLGAGGKLPHLALSTPLDGGQVVQWGRLRWTGDDAPGQLQWSVRTGNRAEPDDSWSAWSKSWATPDQALSVPPSRFLQWRVSFPPASTPGGGPQVTSVSVSAWRPNQAPVIASFQQEYLQDVQLGSMINGVENVTQRFKSGLQAEFSRNAKAEKWAGPVRGALGRSVKVLTWQASDPNQDRLVYRLAYRRVGEQVWRPLNVSRPGVHETKETLTSWDTSEVPDGSYELRLVASDRPDNPAQLALAAEHILGPVQVDNTAPSVSQLQVTATATGFVVRCVVRDKDSLVAGARLRLPDNTLERLDPVDRICDSAREEFAAEIVWPRPGSPAGEQPWQVQVEVRDLSGNIRSVTGEVR